jgi:TonB family protein
MPAPVALDTTGCGSTTDVPTQAWLETHVHTPVIPISGNAEPQVLPGFRRMRIRGEVLTQFIVDKHGAIVWCTFTVLRATHREYEEAVRNAIANWRYEPATLFGQNVPQLVQLQFRFPRP